MLGGSWTDLATNQVLLTRLSDLGTAGVRDLVSLGLPGESLSSFLHEATHHWSFRSYVGMSLALQELTLKRRILFQRQYVKTAERLDPKDRDFWLSLPDHLSDIWEARTLHHSFNVTSAFLRPLAEGLALFAEFDARYPSTSPIVADPMQAVGHFIRPRHFEDLPTRDEQVADI